MNGWNLTHIPARVTERAIWVHWPSIFHCSEPCRCTERHQMIATPTGHAAIPLAVRHVSPTTDIREHDTNTRNCFCEPRTEAVAGGYVVIHNRTPLADELDERLTSVSSRALTYVIKRAKAIQSERLADGVFE